MSPAERDEVRPGQLVWHRGTKQTGLVTATKPYPDGSRDLLVRYVDTDGTWPEHWVVGHPGGLTWWGTWHLGGRGPFNRQRWMPQRTIDEIEAKYPDRSLP